jgi:hypothetical protein
MKPLGLMALFCLTPFLSGCFTAMTIHKAHGPKRFLPDVVEKYDSAFATKDKLVIWGVASLAGTSHPEPFTLTVLMDGGLLEKNAGHLWKLDADVDRNVRNYRPPPSPPPGNLDGLRAGCDAIESGWKPAGGCSSNDVAIPIMPAIGQRQVAIMARQTKLPAPGIYPITSGTESNAIPQIEFFCVRSVAADRRRAFIQVKVVNTFDYQPAPKKRAYYALLLLAVPADAVLMPLQIGYVMFAPWDAPFPAID